MHRPQIFLADLLRGIERLRVRDAKGAAAILRMLSLDRLEVAQRHATASGPMSARRGPTRPPATESMPEPAPPRTSDEVREAYLTRRSVGSGNPAPPLWFDATSPLRSPAGPTPASRLFQPLFAHKQGRGLLAATLATLDPEGPVDLSRAVEELAQLRPLKELPRERVTTLRLGAQVLLDAGLGLAPFRPDVDDLLAQITKMLIPEHACVLRSVGTPLRGCVADGRTKTGRWTTPVGGTPILIVTDLGIGEPAGSRERATVGDWLEFLEAARAHRGPVTALVPYGPQRWPRGLTGAVRIVHWDRRTTAGAVRRSLVSQLRARR